MLILNGVRYYAINQTKIFLNIIQYVFHLNYYDNSATLKQPIVIQSKLYRTIDPDQKKLHNYFRKKWPTLMRKTRYFRSRYFTRNDRFFHPFRSFSDPPRVRVFKFNLSKRHTHKLFMAKIICGLARKIEREFSEEWENSVIMRSLQNQCHFLLPSVIRFQTLCFQ